MTRPSADIAIEIAQRLLFAQEYPAALCQVEAADYHHQTRLLVTAYGDALVAERAREERALVLAPVLRRMLEAQMQGRVERLPEAPKSVPARAEAA